MISYIVLSLSISAFIFPSLLQEYSIMGSISNRIPFAGFIFVIDELIALIGLLCSFIFCTGVKYPKKF